MALHWATAFAIGGVSQNYIDSGWYPVDGGFTWNSTYATRTPLCGYGGMTQGLYQTAAIYDCSSPIFPRGELAEGIVQYHLYSTSNNGNYRFGFVTAEHDSQIGWILLQLDVTDFGFCRLRISQKWWNGGSWTTNADVYVDNLTFSQYSWHTIALGTDSGRIYVSVDGNIEDVCADPRSETLTRVYMAHQGIATGVTVWDTYAAATMTDVHWAPCLRPDADATDGSWSASAGSDLYAMVDETSINTADYDTTTTNPDTLRFSVNSADIDASWNPSTIYGVALQVSARGDGTISDQEATIHEGADDAYGTVTGLDTTTRMTASELFLLQADASTAWDVTAIDAHEYGVRAS